METVKQWIESDWMDKNKSRTDLLAAGRKKLEKFRQKKDNKGSNSKSTAKATKVSKSAHDASVDAAVTHGNISPNEFAENAQKAIPPMESDNASLPVVTNNDAEEAQQGDDHSVCTHHFIGSEIVSAVRSQMSGFMGEDVSGLSDEKEREIFDVSGVYGGDQSTKVNPEVIEERCLDSKNYGTVLSRGSTVVDLTSGVDGGLIKLSQLAEILQSRTDLLVCGRKKLEKFRQKKDNKGSNSKSTAKATKVGKSAHDASVDAASEAAVTQNVADGEKSNHDAQDTSALSDLDARGNLVANDTTVSTDKLSGKAVILDTASPPKTAEIQSEASVNNTMLNQSAGDACEIDSEILRTGRFSSLVPEDAKYYVSYSPNVVAPRENSPDSGIPMPADFTSQLERPHAEEQEVGRSSENQIDGGMAAQVKGDGSISPNEFAENAQKAIPPIEPDNASLPVVTNDDAEESQQGDDHSVCTHHFIGSEIVSAVRSQVSGFMGEDVSGLSDEKEREIFDVSGVYGGDQSTKVNPEVIEKRCLDSKNYDTVISRGDPQ